MLIEGIYSYSSFGTVTITETCVFLQERCSNPDMVFVEYDGDILKVPVKYVKPIFNKYRDRDGHRNRFGVTKELRKV